MKPDTLEQILAFERSLDRVQQEEHVRAHADELPEVLAQLYLQGTRPPHPPFGEIELRVDPWKAPAPPGGLLAFWEVDGTGSCFCLFGFRDQEALDTPVVYVGSEGAFAFVAATLRELLALVAACGEVALDVALASRRPDHQPTDRDRAFADWLAEALGLAPMEDVEAWVKRRDAQAERFYATHPIEAPSPHFRYWAGPVQRTMG
ncbi:MAG: hypothetical protein H6739_03180 [Alphaproteobacteria bacterium]|nr:hypothetical protein [Alphaproteobacteria bacterium]